MRCDILYTILNSWPCLERPLWPWSYGSWIYNYLYNQCISLLMLWVRISSREWCTVLCDKGRWFSPKSPVSSTNKTDSYDITKLLLKVVLRTIEQTMLRFTSKSPLNIVEYNIYIVYFYIRFFHRIFNLTNLNNETEFLLVYKLYSQTLCMCICISFIFNETL